MSTALKTGLELILAVKTNKIIPENIKNGVNIFNVTGNYTGSTQERMITNIETEHIEGVQSLLTSIPNLNTSNVTNMYCMFDNCTNLTSIPEIDTSNVTNMQSMFYNCWNLPNIPNINYSNANTIHQTFAFCSSLINISNLTFPNVNDATMTFCNCLNLQSVSSINLPLAKNTTQLFRDCINLTNVSNLTMNNATIINGMFSGCNNLSNASVQNIINSLLNAPNVTYKNLRVANTKSPFYNTKFDNSYYSNRLSELSAAGWTY